MVIGSTCWHVVRPVRDRCCLYILCATFNSEVEAWLWAHKQLEKGFDENLYIAPRAEEGYGEFRIVT